MGQRVGVECKFASGVEVAFGSSGQERSVHQVVPRRVAYQSVFPLGGSATVSRVSHRLQLTVTTVDYKLVFGGKNPSLRG